MKRRLLILSCCLAFSAARAASECPGFPALATSGEALLAQVRALPPVGIDRERQACAPATVIDFAYSGGVLCSFGSELEAATSAVTRLADGGELVEYLYLFPYAPATHARLLALLAARFTPVDKAAWPAFLQAARPGKETTALFTHGGFYISLGKPTEGDPAEWYSNVIFEKLDKPALGVRKVCKEARDG
ncbi:MULTISPECIES: hypothetical protein [unclassified Janthinobacterium]|uniref:hypothetical protein n=1 Tax=unclassified Janthinobacterium TaxID=2610881 RepID=UPI001E482CFC|nr:MULTISPECIES: hypothetical protein [unclassified Janthinobacterium]MCC7645576.1 hypothetical protein [Janthinobacterium sp. EB271-G4-3-1]MCC7691923.1 hypothetical protein [Janthinobacterium sp. EB271-G4-3-2]